MNAPASPAKPRPCLIVFCFKKAIFFGGALALLDPVSTNALIYNRKFKHIKGNLNQGRDKIERWHVTWTSNALYTLCLFWLPDYLNEWILGNLKFLGCGGYNNTATFQGFSVIRPIIWIYKAPPDFFCHFDKNAIKFSFCAALFCVITCYDTTVLVIIMMMIIGVIKCLVCNKYMITATLTDF